MGNIPVFPVAKNASVEFSVPPLSSVSSSCRGCKRSRGLLSISCQFAGEPVLQGTPSCQPACLTSWPRGPMNGYWAIPKQKSGKNIFANNKIDYQITFGCMLFSLCWLVYTIYKKIWMYRSAVYLLQVFKSNNRKGRGIPGGKPTIEHEQIIFFRYTVEGQNV